MRGNKERRMRVITRVQVSALFSRIALVVICQINLSPRYEKRLVQWLRHRTYNLTPDLTHFSFHLPEVNHLFSLTLFSVQNRAIIISEEMVNILSAKQFFLITYVKSETGFLFHKHNTI